MIQLSVRSVPEICNSVALRVKQRRLELNLTQQGMALRSGVNIETYRKFERTGEIAFVALVKIALVLDALDEVDRLFAERKYQSIDEIAEGKQMRRKRGKNT